jgi:hypothetical protein
MGNEKKNAQLGMPIGTASNRLRKRIIFSLLRRLGETNCFRCGCPIETFVELSVEHKTPWLDTPDPVAVFFDIENIAFSHLTCNVGEARKGNQRYFTPEARLEADRRETRERMRRNYTTEERREKYLRTGY